jgi:hypothetical protein
MILNVCLGNALLNLGTHGLDGDNVYHFLTNCYQKAAKNCMNSYQKIGTLFEIKNGVVPAAIGVPEPLIMPHRYTAFVNCFIKKYRKY